MNNYYYEPPLGIMPEQIWKRQRCRELSNAITRYLNFEQFEWSNPDRREVVLMWIAELQKILSTEIICYKGIR